MTAAALTALIPPAEPAILVDEGHSPVAGLLADRRWFPFLERDGQYWGKPENDTVAIHELERLRRSGARFVVFVWPALWWLEYYSGLSEYLRAVSLHPGERPSGRFRPARSVIPLLFRGRR